jgi:hypothetical protein
MKVFFNRGAVINDQGCGSIHKMLTVKILIDANLPAQWGDAVCNVSVRATTSSPEVKAVS